MITSNSINQRFLKAVESIVNSGKFQKITKGAIGERIGIKQVSNLSRLAKANQGSNRSVSVENCARLCSEFQVSPEWLLLGTGEMMTTEVKIVPSESERIEMKITDLAKRVLQIEEHIKSKK